ncbi:hypothetical protein M513_02686 [Trichuris suis]|uniref:Small acidic protein-like domain-containing protein n=1 Tax=Trichuris suis TaxID=68888 RepID=A0A085MH86_9BILA|nr:hypothetical protein M513_02686 [Trichuris suis]
MLTILDFGLTLRIIFCLCEKYPFPIIHRLASIMESIGEYTLTSDEEKEVANQPELPKDQMTTEENHSEPKAADGTDSLGASEVPPAEGQSTTLESSACTTSEEKPVSADNDEGQRKCHSERRSSVSSRRHHHHHHRHHRSKNRSPSHGKSRSSRRRSRSSSSSTVIMATGTIRVQDRSRSRRSFRERVDGHRPERGTVNADDLMQQVQERKRLWQSNKADRKISSQWQQLISSCDSRQTANKFRKLMGIKGDAVADDDPNCAQKQECDRSSRVMENLDRQYAEARILTHTCRGMGLGYGSGH